MKSHRAIAESIHDDVDIRETARNYIKRFPEEIPMLDRFLGQIDRGERLGDRKNFTGHVTASGVVFRNNRILLVFHQTLGIYLQPGGHYEDDGAVFRCALREVLEETGLKAELHPWHTRNRLMPIHIDTHAIPSNPMKNEPSHFHHDFVYLMTVPDDAGVVLQEEEVGAYRWVSVEQALFSGHLSTVLGKIRRTDCDIGRLDTGLL